MELRGKSRLLFKASQPGKRGRARRRGGDSQPRMGWSLARVDEILCKSNKDAESWKRCACGDAYWLYCAFYIWSSASLGSRSCFNSMLHRALLITNYSFGGAERGGNGLTAALRPCTCRPRLNAWGTAGTVVAAALGMWFWREATRRTAGPLGSVRSQSFEEQISCYVCNNHVVCRS